MGKVKWEDLPDDIKRRMHDLQHEQGNTRDPAPFIRDISSSISSGGFHWDSSPERDWFWSAILDEGNFDVFYEKYPSGYVGDSSEKSPDYYGSGVYETRKFIDAHNLNFNRGNCIKYIVRAGKKGDAIEDLEKARNYIEFEIERIKNHEQ